MPTCYRCWNYNIIFYMKYHAKAPVIENTLKLHWTHVPNYFETLVRKNLLANETQLSQWIMNTKLFKKQQTCHSVAEMIFWTFSYTLMKGHTMEIEKKNHLPLNMLLAIAPQGQMGVPLWVFLNEPQPSTSWIEDDTWLRSAFAQLP